MRSPCPWGRRPDGAFPPLPGPRPCCWMSLAELPAASISAIDSRAAPYDPRRHDPGRGSRPHLRRIRRIRTQGRPYPCGRRCLGIRRRHGFPELAQGKESGRGASAGASSSGRRQEGYEWAAGGSRTPGRRPRAAHHSHRRRRSRVTAPPGAGHPPAPARLAPAPRPQNRTAYPALMLVSPRPRPGQRRSTASVTAPPRPPPGQGPPENGRYPLCAPGRCRVPVSGVGQPRLH